MTEFPQRPDRQFAEQATKLSGELLRVVSYLQSMEGKVEAEAMDEHHRLRFVREKGSQWIVLISLVDGSGGVDVRQASVDLKVAAACLMPKLFTAIRDSGSAKLERIKSARDALRSLPVTHTESTHP